MRYQLISHRHAAKLRKVQAQVPHRSGEREQGGRRQEEHAVHAASEAPWALAHLFSMKSAEWVRSGPSPEAHAAHAH